MNYFTLLQIFSALFFLLVTCANSAPILLHRIGGANPVPANHEASAEIGRRDSVSLAWHSRKESLFIPYRAADSTDINRTPAVAQDNNNTIQNMVTRFDNTLGASSFIETHPIPFVVTLTLAPFILCLLLYPMLRYIRNKRIAARKAKESASEPRFDEKSIGSPMSAYLNNPALHPLPTFPQSVYVPPSQTGDGASIFGHFRSHSGDVHGTDCWVIVGSEAGGRLVNKSKENIAVYAV